ncbi:DUF11 domain-containing protein [Stieleria sp. TO1_6]|uniref:SdrD B-like domain-containing protein n=1 Tax=Stieleria tagensis TaxID=2956795 RepID=UPI00209AD40A|nr:SdrD B-like domain-containing protein [Stieleria tagensis]MCO8124080.1 DUF11 domain-containing protein [Stieleria tagensis]
MRRVLAAATNLAAISGTVYDDINNNNVVDAGDVRIADAQIRLESTSGSLIQTTTSDASGLYSFPMLTAGSYIVRQPAQTTPSNRNLVEKVSSTITITTDDVTGTLSTRIDSFDSTSQTVTDNIADNIPVTSQMNAPEAIGGQRDLVVNDVSASDDSGVQLAIASSLGVISFDSLTGGDGERRVIWDGIDSDPINVDDTGLDVDLTAGGQAFGFNLVAGSDSDDSIAILRLYSDDNNPATASRYSFARVPIPETASFDIREIEYVAFTAFQSVGGGADLTNITAIELEIEGGRRTDGVAELIGAFAMTQFNADFDNYDEAELAITKTVDNASPNVGDTINYTVQLTNNGPADATNVQVTDQLPAGVQFLSSSAGNNYNASTGIWNVGTLTAGQNNQATLVITGRVTTVGSKNNVATITRSDQTDQIDSNNSASVNLTPQQIDLEVSKSIDNVLPNVGDTVTFTVVAANRLGQDATGVQVRDQLPAGLRIAAPGDVTTTTGSYNSANGVWDVGTISGNTTETLTIRAIVDTAGSRTNSAEVIAANEADIDSIPGDGTGDDFSSVTFATAAANLSLTKTVDDATPNLNSIVNFTVTVSNAGPNDATGVTVLDQLPPGLTFLMSSAPGQYNPNTGIWDIGTLPNNGSTSLTIQASVDQIGVKTNSAQVETADQDDSNSTPGNDVPGEDDQAQVQITPQAADLSLIKSVNNLSPDIGDTVRFQITVSNSGPSTATGVQVRDQLPSGTQFVAANYAPGSGNGGVADFDSVSGIWNVGTLASGTSVTLNLDAIVTGAGFQTNMAEIIASDQPDTDSTPNNGDPTEDDQDDAQIRPRQIDLMLNKTVDNYSPTVGDEIEFVITVNNTGDDVATGVTVAEQLPAGVTSIDESPSRGSYDRSTGIWTIGSIGINDPVTLTIRTRVDSIGMGTNSAQVQTADQRDIDSTPGNNVPTEDDQDSVAFTTESADLSLEKVVFGDSHPNAGDQISFDITVTNSGPDNATGVQVRDLLPTGLTYVSNSVSAGIYNSASGVWTIGEVPAPTERQTLIIGPEVFTATSGNMVFSQQNSPITHDSPIALFQSDPLGETANALVALGYLPSQFQLREVSLATNPSGINIEIRFLGTALEGVDVPRINVIGNLNTAVNTETIEDSAVDVNAFATLRINAIVDTINDVTNIAQVIAADQADPDSTPGNSVETEDDYASATIMPQSIDLSLTKTASVDRPNPGDEVTFTLSVSNDGQDPATGVEVTDLLPPGLTFVRSQPSGVYDPTTGVWTVGGVGTGETESLLIVVMVNSDFAETNNAEVTAADQRDIDSTPGNGDPNEDDSAGATVTPATADLSVSKTVDDNTPNVGSQVVFTIVVANDGPDIATGVQLRDQIPAGMTVVESTVSTGTYDAGTGVWDLDMIAVDGQETLTITASVDSVDDKTNIAQIIASDQFDPDSRPANDDPDEDDQDSAALSPELVDLALVKTVDDDNPNIGEVVLFELGVSNEGPSTATGVTVLDQLPDGLTYQTSRASLGVYDPNTGIWNVGEVPVGATPTLQIEAVVGMITGAVNTAEIQSADQPDSDSTPANGDPSEDDQASVTLTTQIADLSLTKSVNNDAPGRNDEVEFTIRVTNLGPNHATEVVVNDPLPPGLRFVSSDATGGSYDPDTGLWTIPTIDADQFQQLRLVAAVTSAEPSTNVAEIIQSQQIDPNSTPGNGDPDEDDIASASVTPPVIDISVAGTTSNETPLEGDTIQVAFTATNDGPADATGIEFAVAIPDGFALVSSQPQSGSYDSTTGRWNLGDLDAGQATRLVLNLRIDQRGIKNVEIELVAANEFDIDSTPDNQIDSEDDQASVLIKAPRLLQKRLFLSR